MKIRDFLRKGRLPVVLTELSLIALPFESTFAAANTQSYASKKVKYSPDPRFKGIKMIKNADGSLIK